MTIQETAKPKGLAKIWREIKSPFRGRMRTLEIINELQSRKSKVEAVFGTCSKVSQHLADELRFYRWKAVLGGDIVRFLRIAHNNLIII